MLSCANLFIYYCLRLWLIFIMLLKQLLEGVQRTKLILIQDSKNESGLLLLKEFIKSNIKRNKLHLLCFENNISTYQNYLEDHEKGNIKFYDFVTDPKGWFKDTVGKSNLSNNINLFTEIRTSILLEDKHPVIVIDSLSSALVSIDLNLLYRQVHQLMNLALGKDIIALQVIAVIHKDYLVDGEVALLQFQHLATSTINVEYDGKSALNVFTKLKKLNGKLIQERNTIYLDSNNQLVIEEEKNLNSGKSVVYATKEITENLTTFKLDLRAQEKEARNQLLLPYLKTEEKPSSGGGNIYYEPDASDDWDEEDPDDDLDI